VSDRSKDAFSDSQGRYRETRPQMWKTIAGELKHTEPSLRRVTSGQCLLHYRIAVNGGATINGTGTLFVVGVRYNFATLYVVELTSYDCSSSQALCFLYHDANVSIGADSLQELRFLIQL
jgi:hypothetical protein